ncbi:MAG: twin-arginine translocase subunit TatC [Syntrophobacterales bacterium]|nr:twin-arginine translocase subunit TatC [Syntrophobacterales bacterium]
MNNPDTNEKMPFTSHLEEMRSRLLRVIIVVGILFVICYFFKKNLFEILTIPLAVAMPESGTMIFTGLPEAFFTYLKVAFFGAIFLASPYILYQIWKFVSPGLFESEKKYVFPFMFFSVTFFLGGSAFAYYVVFPFGFKFFLAFGTDFIKPMLSIREYLSFSFKLLLAFGIIFELPVFMFFLSRIGLINSRTLTAKRKYAILVIFITAALFTPPDVVTQVMMALPLILLYEISVWVVKLGEKKVPREETPGNE